jgi:hypothetical protein
MPGSSPFLRSRGCRRLPDDDFMALWKAIILDHHLKDLILAQAVLNFTLRPRIHRRSEQERAPTPKSISLEQHLTA